MQNQFISTNCSFLLELILNAGDGERLHQAQEQGLRCQRAKATRGSLCAASRQPAPRLCAAQTRAGHGVRCEPAGLAAALPGEAQPGPGCLTHRAGDIATPGPPFLAGLHGSAG